MPKDYNAQLFAEHRPALRDLARAEDDLKVAKRNQDKMAQKEAQRTIDEQRHLLAHDMPTVAFHYLDNTKLADADGLRSTWQRQVLAQPDAPWKTLSEEWHLTDLTSVFEQPPITLTDLLPLSFWLSFGFTLAKPYISHDENALYVIDNSVRKDKVLHLPFVAPSTYKGALRSAARYEIGSPPTPEVEPDNPVIERLYGTDKRRKTKDLHLGRLWFFPTFFRKVSLEVINPHRRDTGAGDKPIPFEVATGTGVFNLLYVPFDMPPTAFDEVAADIEGVAKAVQAMFLTYGLAAKKTSGFGIAEPTLRNFKWQVNYQIEHQVGQGRGDEVLEQRIAAFVRQSQLVTFPRLNNADLKSSGWGADRITAYKQLRGQHPDWDPAERRWSETVSMTSTAPERVLLQIDELKLDLWDLVDIVRDRLVNVLQEANKGE